MEAENFAGGMAQLPQPHQLAPCAVNSTARHNAVSTNISTLLTQQQLNATAVNDTLSQNKCTHFETV